MEEYPSSDSSAIMAFFGVIMFVSFAIWIFSMVCYWKIFTKAGRPGWAAIVPIYNIIVFLEIAGKPWWWLFLLCIPFVNFIFVIIALHALSTSFGQGVGMTILMLFFIGFAILAFGDAQYQGQKPLAAQPI